MIYNGNISVNGKLSFLSFSKCSILLTITYPVIELKFHCNYFIQFMSFSINI